MHKHILFYQRRLGISTVERRERKKRRYLRFSVGFPGNALTASRASVATLAIFASRRAAKTLVGEPPQTRHFGTSCPEVCCLRHRCLSLLFLIFALVRQAEQMIDIRLDRHGLPHIRLGFAVLGIEGFFLFGEFPALLFQRVHFRELRPA